MSIDIHHPHDSFFRASLSNLEVAQDLLKAHLAPELVGQIDWNTLQITNKSYVDEKLKHLQTDMVYSCKLNGQDAYIYTLIEQQTKPDPLLAFRLFEYNVTMMREHLKQGNKKLPLIANLVLYSGKQTPYPHSVDIYDCFEEPGKAREMMFKPLTLIDLGQLSEEELAQHGSADLLELLLKQSRKRTFYEWVEEHPEFFKALFRRAYGISGIVYILSEENEYSGKEIVDKLKSINPAKEEDIMQAVRTIRQESELIGEKRGETRGMQKGMQQGMQQGEYNKGLEIAKNMLKLHLDTDTVQKATGISRKELEQVIKELKALGFK